MFVLGSRQRGDPGVDGPDAARLLNPALLQALEEELPRHQPASLLRLPLPEGGGSVRARGMLVGLGKLSWPISVVCLPKIPPYCNLISTGIGSLNYSMSVPSNLFVAY